AESFRMAARGCLSNWVNNHLASASPESYARLLECRKSSKKLEDNNWLRDALLDFIADFANWDNANNKLFLDVSRTLTAAAHESLGNAPGSRPIVADPFAGGGSIPLEALRIGGDAFASDLNPIPVLLNKVLLEYVPRYRDRLAEELKKAGDLIGRRASKELARFFPVASDGSTPIAYLWARTIRCEGPGCGVEIPMLRSLSLAKGQNGAQLTLQARKERRETTISVEVKGGRSGGGKSLPGTVKRGSVTCPVCGFTIARQRVEVVANELGLGERMIAVVLVRKGQTGRKFWQPSVGDKKAWDLARDALNEQQEGIPDEPLPYLRSIFNVHVYGVKRWSELFSARQLLCAVTFVRLLRELRGEYAKRGEDKEFADAVTTMLALAVDRQINALNRTCYWNPTGPKMQAGFARQAIPMFWDYCEANPFGGSVGSWESMINCVLACFDAIDAPPGSATVVSASATNHPLPDDSVDAVVTDPPYYDAVPYADLSDFFYVWLKRMLADVHPALFRDQLTPKREEIVQLAERNPAYSYKTKENFEQLMTEALSQARRIAKPRSVSVVVFAHQSTAGWEAMLSALIQAGWTVTASWPIDTEMPTRVRAQNSAVLASSVHLVCRPRGALDAAEGASL